MVFLKAGLLTFYHLHHYGALLQAVATQRALEGLGWECETIDYFVAQDNRILQPPTSPGRAACAIPPSAGAGSASRISPGPTWP